MSEFSKFWDEAVKPLAEKVIKKASVDSTMINHYVGGMVWAVEHDLADGRLGFKALNGLCTVKNAFSSDSYYENVHKNTPQYEINRMKNLASQIEKLMEMGVDE